jgi:primase-polymerase (primpol)-like protein
MLDGMESINCQWCGVGMPLARADAQYCSAAHRVAANRAKKRSVLPAEMTARDRWMRWELVRRGDKWTKRPITIAGRAASSTNAATWAAHSDAAASAAGVGLGFALGDGIGCIDLDDCIRADGSLEPWAADILASCPPTFMEVSQSGAGIHIFGLLPEAPGRNLRSAGATVEVYSTGRFIAVTGTRFGAAPSRLADLSEVVASVL